MAAAGGEVTFGSDPVAHLFQVGAGSGGMPVLDMVCRDERITHVTLVEPDVYKPHNVVRHLFPSSAVGRGKGELAAEWLREHAADVPSSSPHVTEGEVLITTSG